MSEELSIVGKSVQRFDAVSKARGESVYFSDMKLPGMLYGQILRSPLPHARIKSIDTSKAAALSGVFAVATAKDTAGIKFGHNIADESIFAVERVRFVGDEVAAVAAVDPDTAREALELINVEYEELPAVLDLEQAAEEGAPLVHAGADNIASSSCVERGDVDKLFAEADYVFSDIYRTGQVHPAYMEPFLSIAAWEGKKLSIWAPFQNPYTMRNMIAKALGLSPSNVRVIHQLEVGGAFGGKLDSKLPFIAAVLARKAGRPVRLINSKEEELSGASRMRVNVVIRLETAVKKDGTLLAKKVDILADNGAYSGQAPKIVCTNMAIRSDNLYRFQAVRTRARLVYTNKIPTGAYRGYGNPQMHFATESQMDTIAERLGMDPIELRLKNAVRTGDKTLHGWDITSGGLVECIERAGQESGWVQKKANKQKYRGIGIACMIHVSGNRGGEDFHGSEAIIRLQADGQVQLLCGEVEIGQGSWTVLSQIAAEELGVPLSQMEWVRADTDTAPFIYGAFSSRTTHIAGNAVRQAARKVKAEVLIQAAELLKVPAENLVIKAGLVGVPGSGGDWNGATLTLAEVAKAHQFSKGGSTILAHGKWDPDTVLLGPDKFGNISSAYPFAAQIAEVEVDPRTGKVTVLNFTAAHDLGKAINPVFAEGQIEGGVAQGLGYALLEEIKYRPDGHVQNATLLDYQLPTMLDVPEIKSILVECLEPQGPFGAKGLGEPTLIPVAAAVANAVYDAVGVRINSIPITAEKIVQALAEKEKEAASGAEF